MWFMWLPLFGTFWWIFTLAILIAIIALEENEFAGSAFGVVFAWLLIVTFFGDGSFIWRAISNHPWTVGIGAVIYFVCGLPWAALWWWWKQSEKRAEYDDERKTFCIEKNVCDAHAYSHMTEIPDDLLAEWQGLSYYHTSATNMRAFWTEHRPALTCAMTWWPIHSASFFFKDFLWSFWKRMLDLFGGVFNRIDTKVWSNVSRDFRQVPDEHLPNDEASRRVQARRGR